MNIRSPSAFRGTLLWMFKWDLYEGSMRVLCFYRITLTLIIFMSIFISIVLLDLTKISLETYRLYQGRCVDVVTTWSYANTCTFKLLIFSQDWTRVLCLHISSDQADELMAWWHWASQLDVCRHSLNARKLMYMCWSTVEGRFMTSWKPSVNWISTAI